MHRVTTFLAGALLASAFSGAALSADLPVKAAPLAPVPAAYNWTGFYLGANFGYGWGRGDTTFDPLPTAAIFVNLAPTTLGLTPRGALGGLQLGYNWQTGMMVFGVETDFQWSGMDASVTQAPIIQNNGTPFPGAGFLTASERTDWFGTLRARFGVTPVDRLLLYVTGGLAYGHVKYSADTDFRPVGTENYPASVSKTRAGWTVGAGAEWAFMPHWSLKAEYLYYDLGNESVTVNPAIPLPPFQVHYQWETRASVARVGVNYKF